MNRIVGIELPDEAIRDLANRYFGPNVIVRVRRPNDGRPIRKGDRRWVREEYSIQCGRNGDPAGRYGADGEWFYGCAKKGHEHPKHKMGNWGVSAKRMPRWASRLTVIVLKADRWYIELQSTRAVNRKGKFIHAQ